MEQVLECLRPAMTQPRSCGTTLGLKPEDVRACLAFVRRLVDCSASNQTAT